MEKGEIVMIKKYLFWFTIAIMASLLIREVNFLIKTGSDRDLIVAIALIALLIIAALGFFLNALIFLAERKKRIKSIHP